MTRATRNSYDIPFLMDRLNYFGVGAPTVEEKLRLVAEIRAYSNEAGKQVDQFLIEQLTTLNNGLREAQDNQAKLGEILDKLAAPPLHTALFHGLVRTSKGEAAKVTYGSTRRIVSIAEELDPCSFSAGDEVLLGNELNVIIEKSPYSFFQSGETATFDRYTEDGRMVIKWRDEEVVVDIARQLENLSLHAGDQVRWDRNVWMAFEKLERSKGTDLFLEETPQETFDSIGGLDRQIEELQRSIRLHMQHAETVRKYQLRRKGSVLLVGPPGTGKTMMARSLANWLARISRSGRSRFMNIKPASLHSMWYAQSEANYREVFRVARAAGEQEPDVPVVMFFDEIDSVGGARGMSLMRVNDRVLTAFMCELDGLEERGNVLVVAATNRRDALDPALLRPGRLGDSIIEVPRPTMRAAREIFAKHLRVDIPYAVNGNGAEAGAMRQEIIDSVVSRIYSPNGENELATLTLRDGKRRTVKAAELISGASIAKIALAATERACTREIEMNRSGLELEDVLTAMAEEFEAIARTLSPANCHQHLSGLPQDVDIVSVEPVVRKVSRPHKYLRVA